MLRQKITKNESEEIKAEINTQAFFTHNQMSNDYVAEQQQEWFERISRETTAHCAYLSSIGLADRAVYFKVRPFIYQECLSEGIDINRFNHNMPLPSIVCEFNSQEKNTLFVRDESFTEAQEQEEINRVLDIRLYPTIRRLIEEKGARIFLGSKIELQVFTASNKEKILLDIEVPSSVKFYITLTNVGEVKVYIANIVSHENLIQQLITLKLAGLDVHKLPILGDTQYYKLISQKDLLTFEKQSSSYLAKKNVLIVAGCSLEDTVCSTLEQIFFGKMTRQKYLGTIASLTYVHSQHAPNLGFIILNLNYGEICEEQISMILDKFNCIGVFSGSAAGYLPGAEDKLPEIGDRAPVRAARHYSGELVTMEEKPSQLHVQVPTLFLETFNWLKQAKDSGATTVDVETFYILRAVCAFQKANPQIKLHTDIGVFISDYVGKKPLRGYANVFAKYPVVLHNFIDEILVANLTPTYNNNRTSIPTFANQYFAIQPETIEIDEEMREEAVVDSIGNYWDKSEFTKRVHTPVTIGKVTDQNTFTTKDVPRCLHLPIKLPGSDIRIPIEYQHFSEALQQIFNFEVSINPGWSNLYAYLTVDQGFIPRSNSQRVPGPHVDGIPRDRDNPGTQLIDHAYLVTNAIPTMFYTQKFDMSPYDPRIHHFFAIFRALSDESRIITLNPYEIGLMDAYSVHTPTQTLEDVTRTFIRLEFSTLQFDRIGNSVNHHFGQTKDYPFNYVPRPIPKHLFVPPEVYLNKPITSEDYTHESIDHFGRLNLRAFFTQNDRYKLKQSAYKDLVCIATNIMDERNQGIVITHQGIPHAFCLFQIENKKIKLDTIFTLTAGKGQEIMIYAMNILNQLSEKFAIQAGLKEGSIPITIVLDENNNNMLRYFLRAARLAKIEVNIERFVPRKLSIEGSPVENMMVH
jgi:hypothetical protein